MWACQMMLTSPSVIDKFGMLLTPGSQPRHGDYQSTYDMPGGPPYPPFWSLVERTLAGSDEPHGLTVADNDLGAGIKVTAVERGTPAEHGQLVAGDVIYSVNGAPATTSAVLSLLPGDNITVHYNGCQAKVVNAPHGSPPECISNRTTLLCALGRAPSSEACLGP